MQIWYMNDYKKQPYTYRIKIHANGVTLTCKIEKWGFVLYVAYMKGLLELKSLVIAMDCMQIGKANLGICTS